MPKFSQRVVFVGAIAAVAAVVAVPPLSATPAKRLGVSANHRFLVHENGRPVNKVRLSAVSGREVSAWWFNPLDGRATRIGTCPSLGERLFTPPDLGEELDRVLVLGDHDRGFPPLGTH